MTEQTKPMQCAVCGGEGGAMELASGDEFIPVCQNCGTRSTPLTYTTPHFASNAWNRAQRRILAERHWQAMVSALQGSAVLVAAETGKVATEARALRLVDAAKAIACAAVKR